MRVCTPVLLVLFLVLPSSSVRGYDDGLVTRATRPFLSIDDDFSVCGSQRLFTWNTSFVYNAVVDELKEAAAQNGASILDTVAHHGERELVGVALERCLWNKTRFLIQVAYFGLFDDVIDAEMSASQSIVDILATRNEMFRRWWRASLDVDIARAPSDFYEWEGDDVRDETLLSFLARDSRILPWMSALARRFVLPPAYGDDDDTNHAENVLHHILKMRTPLSSVGAPSAMLLSQRQDMADAMTCLADAVPNLTCDKGALFSAATQCAQRVGIVAQRDVLVMLGLFSAQEAFLLRDTRVFVDAHFDAALRSRVLGVFFDGARVYYEAERVGARCGDDPLFPSSHWVKRGSFPSTKMYHYYAMALNAYLLREHGFDDDTAETVTTGIGRFYKRSAVILGLIYNRVTGIPLMRGTTPDFRGVTSLQALGSAFGNAAYRADASTKNASPFSSSRTELVPLDLWPNVLRLERDDVDSSHLRVVIAHGLLRRDEVLTFPLRADERASLISQGLVYPRVDLVDGGIRLSFPSRPGLIPDAVGDDGAQRHVPSDAPMNPQRDDRAQNGPKADVRE